MLQHIEHIGIAVKNLAAAIDLYEKLLDQKAYKTESVLTEQVVTAFFKTGINKIELLEASHPDSAIAKFIEKRGEGIHHIAFAVDDIYSEMTRLQQAGFVLLNDRPKRGADNKLVCFVHPKSSHGVLIELCQEIPLDESI